MANRIVRFFGRMIDKYLKPWFFSSEDPNRIKAPYVISLVFLSLTILSIVFHLAIKLWQFEVIKHLWREQGPESLPFIMDVSKMELSLVPLITVLVGSAGLFIGLYNWGRQTGPSRGYTSDAPQQPQPAQNQQTGSASTGSGDGPISNSEV